MSKSHQQGEFVEKVKVRVGELRLGMYVCELDRPWLETPFLFQGFELKSVADIEAIRQYCDYVYVDLLRTRVVHMKINDLPPQGFREEPKSMPFDKAMKAANTTREQTSSLVKTFIDDIRFGHSVDLQLAKSAVAGCVDNIMRNPDAMIFMAQMRDKDEQISQHAFNTCVYSIILGRQAGLDTRELENIGTCGLLHDVGKVMVPECILNKPGKLVPDEFAIMRQHTTQGRDILMSGRSIYSGAVDVAFAHHENLDGSGYPRGLEGHQLNLNSKIVSIVDKYAALTSARPHRSARDHLYAVNVLNKLVRRNQIDNALTSSFISYLGIYPPGTVVELSTREIAIVLEANPKQRLRPQIMVIRDPDKNPVATFVDMALKQTDDHGQIYKIKAVHNPDDLGIDLSHYKNAILQAFG